MQVIPLQAVPAQNLAVSLNGQPVAISLYAAENPGVPLTADSSLAVDGPGTVDEYLVPGFPGDALYMDLTLSGSPIVTGKLCSVVQPLLETSQYAGFVGGLAFLDTQSLGLQDSTQVDWEGLGTQYQLIYYTAADVAAGLALPI